MLTAVHASLRRPRPVCALTWPLWPLVIERRYKNYAGKATEDGILKCPKCKSMKTEYVEVQTRSADEPTTKKCMCNNCDHRWKFC